MLLSLAQKLILVGWVERSETHQFGTLERVQTLGLMGFASLYPSYRTVQRQAGSIGG